MERLDDGAAVACSLSDQELRNRRALARRTVMPRLKSWKRIQGGLVLTFAGDENLRSDLETFVRLERQCCGFLEFLISADAAEPLAPIEVRIEGGAGAAATIEMFAEALRDKS